MSIDNISDTETKLCGKNPKYRFFHGQENPPDDYSTICRPTKVHYVKYLLARIWEDKKLRLLLIVSILILKAIITLTIILIIPVIAN
jgi:hypothetical protein